MNELNNKPPVNEIARIVHSCLYGDPGLDRTGVAKQLISELETHVAEQVRLGRIDELERMSVHKPVLDREARLKQLKDTTKEDK